MVEPFSSTVTPSWPAARRACSRRRASTLAGSVPSSRASSPACGVISVGALSELERGSRPWCWLRIVSPSASTRTGTSVRRIAVSLAAATSSVPMPGPATHAWTRPTEPGSQSPSSGRAASGCTVTTVSGHACRTSTAATSAVTTRTMPAPPCTAPPADSSTAPVKRSLPASRPSTPRRYLSDSAPGRGRSSRMSSRCGAAACGPPFWYGSFRYGPRPMSTSSTAPACPAPGSISRPGLSVPKVTVTSARTAGPSTAPVSASMPLGRSTATTVAPACRACPARAARPANGSRSPPRPPMPSRPSTIRSAVSIRAAAFPVSSVTRPPASRSAVLPPGCTLDPAAIAVTATPRRASWAAA